MSFLTSILENYRPYRELLGAVEKHALPAAVTGLSSVHKAHFISSLCAKTGKKAIVLAGDELEAGRLCSDLNAMGLEALIYPARDLDFYPLEGRSRDYEHTRIEALCRMLTGSFGAVVVCPEAAMQLTVPPEQLKNRMLRIAPGMSISLSECARVLSLAGYERADQVDGRGQFSIRGGILDIFPPDASSAVRVEFWGDDIDTMAYFDVDSQRRSDEPLDEIRILPAAELIIEDPAALAGEVEELAASLRGKAADKARLQLMTEADAMRSGRRIASPDKFLPMLCDRETTVLDYLPEDGLLFVSEGRNVAERARNYEAGTNEDIKLCVEEGVLCRHLSRFILTASELIGRYSTDTVYLDAFARGSYETGLKTLVNCTARQNAVWSGSLSVLREDLSALIDRGMSVAVMAGSERAARGLVKDLTSDEQPLPAFYAKDPESLAPGKISVVEGAISAGFEYPEALVSVITWGKSTPAARTPEKKHKRGTAIQDLSELIRGDYVVHASYGIGMFDGVQNRTFDGVTKAFIKIMYAQNEALYIPITQLDLVSKYIGTSQEGTVKVSKLGSGDWARQKARVKHAVKDIAKELTQLYAQRAAAEGYPFAADGEWQRDFEQKFEYEETDDQLRCVREIKQDMESIHPMDRLLCGDVGFGKTEVALRAAFKCVVEGRQCAILVPTTILAWQHYQTALRRFDGYPVKIELLSRFRSPKQQAEIKKKLAKGEIDLVIGTHRVVQKDIAFRDLGLAIIDEEQRFGVAQKERFKELFKGVDCLTLSATPIPRTLNMALSGLRDISVLEEAPLDRHPVQTYVLEHDDGIISEAIRRELRRGGQVFYLHNRVQSIESTAERIQKLVPEAVIAVAHGQMEEGEMSKVWKRLVDQEANVLVCTTIIETGVDVPNCNTLIIENADFFGLSQLHQIRGRVGRSSRRAYAYLTFRRNKSLSEMAAKRLEAIREFTEFGSGMKIAMRDLELRGAGNVLGGEQSGQMATVGYDMYLKLLSDAIAEAKGDKPAEPETECLVDMNINAYIPDSYIESLPTRLSIYRLIASIRTESDRSDVLDELIDRFGDIPEEVSGLCDVALLRNRAAKLGVCEIRQSGGNFVFTLADGDMDALARLAAELRGRVFLTSGAKPKLTVKQHPKRETLEDLSDIVACYERCAGKTKAN